MMNRWKVRLDVLVDAEVMAENAEEAKDIAETYWLTRSDVRVFSASAIRAVEMRPKEFLDST
jgi:hypothetical protein